MHHRRPVHLGGAEHDPANVSVLCRPCHRVEHGVTIARSAWRRELRLRMAASVSKHS